MKDEREMTRVLKEPEERKAEIMDTAQELFHIKGYEATTISDILEKAGIARGTFYYYFKSKDEIMNAVIERGIAEQIQTLMPIVENNNLNALEKLKQLIVENDRKNAENADMLAYLHQPENIVMHQKSLIQGVHQSAPLIAQIIRQGIEEGRFHTEYSLELAEFILVGTSFLFDSSIFHWEREEYSARMKALADILETTLRTEQGCFKFLHLLAKKT
ncbi:MAG TPA: TetR/AcrR family transcriptional regulator [Firmicutes bacterium]|jgi:AcrR family transcriptional regulator|nr:TetR/AcrR family transcriptional regulator [Bacillota bacterium]